MIEGKLGVLEQKEMVWKVEIDTLNVEIGMKVEDECIPSTISEQQNIRV